MLIVFNAILDAVRNAARTQPLATLREEFLKVAVGHAALRAGARMLEGSNRPGMLYELQLKGGRLLQGFVENPGSQLGKSGVRGKPVGTTTPDLRLSHPARFALEIKARCDFGSSRNNQSVTLRKDIERVLTGEVDAFLLLADEQVYRNLRTDRPDLRGQPKAPQDAALFDQCFPRMDQPIRDQRIDTPMGSMSRSHERIVTEFGTTRMLVVMHALNSPVLKSAAGGR